MDKSTAGLDQLKESAIRVSKTKEIRSIWYQNSTKQHDNARISLVFDAITVGHRWGEARRVGSAAGGTAGGVGVAATASRRKPETAIGESSARYSKRAAAARAS